MEFSKKEEAMMALVETGGKMWRGRKLEVGWAREVSQKLWTMVDWIKIVSILLRKVDMGR